MTSRWSSRELGTSDTEGVDPGRDLAHKVGPVAPKWILGTMAGMTETCSVCGQHFDVQFRYQMEERDGGFAFYCSHDCHGRAVRGETTDGVTCAACNKRFRVELVYQVTRVRGELRYACS